MYTLRYTGQFKKDLKLLKKRSPANFQKLFHFVQNLGNAGFKGVDAKYNPHKLIGNYKDCFECHVLNDLLIIWMENEELKEIILVRTGTHSDLF